MSECLKPTNCKAKSLVAKCGSVSSKFAYLMQTKEMMRNMLIQKGQDVPKDLPFRDYVEKIAVLIDPADAVSSIIDYTGTPHKGDVTVDKTFIGLSNVDNTADIDKPISTATQEALDLKQNITDDSLETEAKTIVGAINELDGEVATNTTNIGALQTTVGNAESGLVKDVADNTKAIGTLQTSLAGKQDATISVNIQGEAKTTIPDALTSLDTALTAVKTTADGAAKVDASNIVPATWKGVLGYQSASDVSAAVIAGVTTNTYDDNLDTTAKTIVGAINEINTSNSGKQDSSISIDGITADTVEGALAELDTDISALQNKTQNITQASAGSTQFTGTVQADTFSGTTISGQTITAGTQLTVNGSVTGSAIQTTLSASSTDQQLPSAKAVYDGLAAKQDALTYYEESTAGNGSVTIGATTQAETPPSAVTVANANISVQLTTSTLNTIHANGGILNRETAFKSTSQTGSIGIAEFTNLAGCKVVFDTIASEGGAKSRTVFEYDATNNVWYREVIFGTGASITSMSGGTVNYDLGVAVSSANIVVSML
jgi:hypothetical protein